MSFYHPELLYGLFAIAIPIIIHLFNFKRFKKVYFTNVRFLRNVQQQSKRHSQWRHLLILMLRILTILFLVLAFARPFIPLNKQVKERVDAVNNVSVFLDNSFSMQAESAEGSLFEEGRKKAREIALAYNPSDNFRLLLNNKTPESNRFLNRDEFLDLLDEVHIEPASTPFSSLIDRVSTFDLDNKVSQQSLYMISDFQKTQADIDSWKVDSNVQLNLVPELSARRDNIFIDSCWFETPVLQKSSLLKLHYRINNLSQQEVKKFSVSLIVNKKQKALGSIDLAPFERRNESLVFKLDTAGIYHCRIEMRDYPITYDDNFYFGFKISEQIDVLCIQGDNASDAIRRFYEGDSLFSFVEQAENRVDYSSFPKFQVILLNGLQNYSSGLLMELEKYVAHSGSLIVIPSKDATILANNSLTHKLKLDDFRSLDTARARLKWMDVESAEFNNVFDFDGKKFQLPDNVDLPYFQQHLVLPNNSRSKSIDLITFDDGSSFLRKYQLGQSRVYLFTAAFEEANSNITAHALFVPIMYNVALFGQHQSTLYYNLGQENIINLNSSVKTVNEIFSIAAVDSKMEFIPGVIHTNGLNALIVDENSVQTAANYSVKYKGQEIQACAFNYPRTESDLDSWTIDELRAKIKQNNLKNINILSSNTASLTATVKDLNKGVQLWKLFLSLAVLLLIIELLLLRFMK